MDKIEMLHSTLLMARILVHLADLHEPSVSSNPSGHCLNDTFISLEIYYHCKSIF